ncbi:hypothetical protein GTY75_09020 [Streptomyces sp. SID8381]|uniref:hypothetical protein n=1 Tax=unclassified Streptomyces TaxID=2593676 RepID=UPI000377FC74|nr:MULTISPECIES: hypothetical protein [unclassified Streptomyces]MYX26808.1 hypothetical protein [Streptomyces sp. SID8381]
MAAYPPAEPKQTHPLNLGFTMALLAFCLQVLVGAAGVRMEHGVGYWALVALMQWGTVTLAGYGNKALVAFVAVVWLAGWALWAGLLPAAVIVLVRVVRRARMLAEADGQAPRRGPRPGVWRTVQAWAGWSRP